MADSTQDAPVPYGSRSLTPAPTDRSHTDVRSLLRLNNLLQILTNVAWYVGTPFIPLYLVSHGASVGAVAGLSGIVPLVVALHVGGLVDERGPTIVFVGSVVLFGLGAAMLTAYQGIPQVTTAYTLLAIANIGLTVASQAVVASASTDVTRIRNYGYYALSYSAGAVVGPVSGGFLAARFGYGTAFLAMTVLMLPSLAVAFMLRVIPVSLTILEAMGQRPDGIGVKDAARLLGQHRTTAYRLLGTMVEAGFVHRSADGMRYRLSLRIVELAGAILDRRSKQVAEEDGLPPRVVARLLDCDWEQIEQLPFAPAVFLPSRLQTAGAISTRIAYAPACCLLSVCSLVAD